MSIAEEKYAPLSNASTLWNSRYNSRLDRIVSVDNDPWLERWSTILDAGRSGTVLELGCGGGRDSRYLTDLGLELIAADYSAAALELCRQRAPLADARLIDLRQPLPFDDGQFPIIVASLCLHYFPWTTTVAILAEIRRCLAPGGFLLARVNSSGDIHHGAVGHPEVEPGLYRVDGELKRFFDREALDKLIGSEWHVHNREELTVYRYDSPKRLWEIVLQKR